MGESNESKTHAPSTASGNFMYISRVEFIERFSIPKINQRACPSLDSARQRYSTRGIVLFSGYPAHHTPFYISNNFNVGSQFETSKLLVENFLFFSNLAAVSALLFIGHCWSSNQKWTLWDHLFDLEMPEGYPAFFAYSVPPRLSIAETRFQYENTAGSRS